MFLSFLSYFYKLVIKWYRSDSMKTSPASLNVAKQGQDASITCTEWIWRVEVDWKLVADLQTPTLDHSNVKGMHGNKKRRSRASFMSSSNHLVKNTLNSYLPTWRELGTKTKGREHLVTVGRKLDYQCRYIHNARTRSDHVFAFGNASLPCSTC